MHKLNYFEFRRKAQLWTKIYAQSLEFKSMPFPSETSKSSDIIKRLKNQKKAIDIKDY